MGTMKVIYQDKNLIICIKPYGVNSEQGMIDLVREYLNNPKSYVGIVHRLDTTTSGLMVYALNKETASFLSKQIQDGLFKKSYLCVCENTFGITSGNMEDFLFKDSRKNKVFVIDKERKGAKHASLDYEVLKSIEYKDKVINLCKVNLHTGRTHQIRAQFASRKHPLCGDGKYGSKMNGEIALWSYSLTFKYNKQIVTFTCDEYENMFLRLFNETL